MSAIMMSMKPEAVCSISSGKRRADLRKTYPHFISTPFKVYIYEMLGDYKCRPNIGYTAFEYDGCGMVVGECICKQVEEATNFYQYEKCLGMTAREISK